MIFLNIHEYQRAPSGMGIGGDTRWRGYQGKYWYLALRYQNSMHLHDCLTRSVTSGSRKSCVEVNEMICWLSRLQRRRAPKEIWSAATHAVRDQSLVPISTVLQNYFSSRCWRHCTVRIDVPRQSVRVTVEKRLERAAWYRVQDVFSGPISARHRRLRYQMFAHSIGSLIIQSLIILKLSAQVRIISDGGKYPQDLDNATDLPVFSYVR